MDKVPDAGPRLKLVRVTHHGAVVKERRHPNFGAKVSRFAVVGLMLYLEERAAARHGETPVGGAAA